MPIPEYERDAHEREIELTLSVGIPESLIRAVDDLTPDQRVHLFQTYCVYCGSGDPTCCCMRDC